MGFNGENIKGVVLGFQNQSESKEESHGESNGENTQEENEVLKEKSGLVRRCREEREDLVVPTMGVADDSSKIQDRQEVADADCSSIFLGVGSNSAQQHEVNVAKTNVARTTSAPPLGGSCNMRKSVKHKKVISDNVITIGILNSEALGLIHSAEVSSDGSTIPRDYVVKRNPPNPGLSLSVNHKIEGYVIGDVSIGDS